MQRRELLLNKVSEAPEQIQIEPLLYIGQRARPRYAAHSRTNSLLVILECAAHAGIGETANRVS